MKLLKKGRELIITTGDEVINLPLVSSVAYYKARYFPPAIRWKVMDDRTFLLKIITKAMKHLDRESYEVLVFFEHWYKNDFHSPKKATHHEQLKALLSSQKDIFNKFRIKDTND